MKISNKTITFNDPILDLSQTWDNGSELFIGFKFNTTNTASGANSRFADFQIDGVSKLIFRKDGYIFGDGTSYLNLGASPILFTNVINKIVGDGGVIVGDSFNNRSLYICGGSSLLTDSTHIFSGTQNDATIHPLAIKADYVALFSDAAWSATNYERLSFKPSVSSGWHQIIAETGGTGVDNINIAITPIGLGGLSAHVPDSGVGGGNARGANSVDWQTLRSAATEVASGASSIIIGGAYCTASSSYSMSGGYGSNANTGTGAIALGYLATTSGSSAVAIGGYAPTASGTRAFAGGGENALASGSYSVALGGQGNVASGVNSLATGGYSTTRSLTGAHAHSAGQRAAVGDAQAMKMVLRGTTTDDTPLVLTADAAAAGTTNQMILPNNSMQNIRVEVSAYSSAGGLAKTISCGMIRVTNAAGTALVGSVAVGLNVADGGMSGADFALSADTTNGGLAVTATGIAATTIYWTAHVELIQSA